MYVALTFDSKSHIFVSARTACYLHIKENHCGKYESPCPKYDGEGQVNERADYNKSNCFQ